MSENARFGSGRWLATVECREHGSHSEWLDLAFKEGQVSGSGQYVIRVEGTYDAAFGTCKLTLDRTNRSQEAWRGSLDESSIWGTWADVIPAGYVTAPCSGVFRLRRIEECDKEPSARSAQHVMAAPVKVSVSHREEEA